MIGWAWRESRHVDRALGMRSKFVLAALREQALCHELKQIEPGSSLGRLFSEAPQTIGNLVWPYQCAAWDPKDRFARIAAHLEVLEAIPGLKLAADDKLKLADLSSLSPGTSLIIDRPPWLSREGLLTLSLFKDEFRAFTLSFSLSNPSAPEAFIGGIQGRQGDNILELYRTMTKDFHGTRPRDFLLECFRMFAASIGVRHIYAVSDECKIQRHKYFAKSEAAGLVYDSIWAERGGERVSKTHFELPVDGGRRELDEIAPKKRSMYRRRYQMFDDIMAALPRDLARAPCERFDAQ